VKAPYATTPIRTLTARRIMARAVHARLDRFLVGHYCAEMTQGSLNPIAVAPRSLAVVDACVRELS
jgi:hypothetical protein